MARYTSFQGLANLRWGRYSVLYAYRKQMAHVGVGLAVFYCLNLERAPVTGRLRFMIVPRWLEKKVGERAYRQTMDQFGPYVMSNSSYESRHVWSIMQRLIAVADLPSDIEWKIHVVRGDFPPNAFVLPGGKVFVFQSILPICQDDNGLATVLSHETAHQVCRHTPESMSKAPLLWLAAAGLYALTGYGQLDDFVLQIAFQLPSSRAMEKEADYVGIMMMAKACFNPASAIGLWQRMMKFEQSHGKSVPELLSTHPASEHRIEDIKEELPKAEQVREERCGIVDKFWQFH